MAVEDDLGGFGGTSVGDRLGHLSELHDQISGFFKGGNEALVHLVRLRTGQVRDQGPQPLRERSHVPSHKSRLVRLARFHCQPRLVPERNLRDASGLRLSFDVRQDEP